MKKRLFGLLAALSLLAAIGCAIADPSATSSNTPGFEEQDSFQAATSVYEATAIGYGGELKLEVVAEDGKALSDIRMVYDRESSPIMTRAFPVIRERILQAQTPVVDSVSGATYTSFAVKSAVAEAAKQFGQNYGQITIHTHGPQSLRQNLDPVETQLVIVGGGPAGLAAAIGARESGIEGVILIEKLDILSGNGKFGMNFFDTVGTQAQLENGIVDSVHDFIEEKQGAEVIPARIRAWAEGSAAVDEWFRGMGVTLNYNYGLRNHMAEADAYAGEHIQQGLENRVFALGVDVRTGTKGLDLIFDGDKVAGVRVQHKNDFYDIMADAVIIATGGFSCNKDLLAEYAPGSEIVSTSNQMGATGDFVKVFESHGFQMGNMDVLNIFKMIHVPSRDLTGAGDGFLLVNKNGQRFAAENSSGLPLAHAILEQPDGRVYYIYDHNHYGTMYRLKKHNDLGYHTSANTLEELAENLGIDAAGLVESVEIYNKAIGGEMDDPFRETPYTQPFLEKGPYYGVQVESAIHMTKGGVVANEKAQVLNEQSRAVEGLYAAGEVTCTSGAYNAAVVFGRISGQEAAGYILE